MSKRHRLSAAGQEGELQILALKLSRGMDPSRVDWSAWIAVMTSKKRRGRVIRLMHDYDGDR